jgi:hypothetical protein
MTIINGIEIDIPPPILDTTRVAILNNYQIEDKLHVIAVISNPCQYARRYILAREFIQRMELEGSVILYVVELAYHNQDYYVTQKGNKRHLQLRGTVPLWHKENMINLGVKYLLPKSWRAFAWIDADIEFESTTWASDALKVLNGSKDIIQLFSHAIDMDPKKHAMSIFPSFGFQYSKGSKYGGTGINMWHPGFAWAITRRAYEKIGGLYEKSILGAGDHNMSLSVLGNGLKSVNEGVTQGYKDSILEFELKAKTLRLGYVPGVIRHYFHGTKKNRKYGERWKIIVDNLYNPSIHLTYNNLGLLVPTIQCPKSLLDNIMKYFLERNEDEYFKYDK